MPILFSLIGLQGAKSSQQASANGNPAVLAWRERGEFALGVKLGLSLYLSDNVVKHDFARDGWSERQSVNGAACSCRPAGRLSVATFDLLQVY